MAKNRVNAPVPFDDTGLPLSADDKAFISAFNGTDLDTLIDVVIPTEIVTEPVLVDPTTIYGTVAKGDVESFQADIVKAHKQWAWSTMAVGDYITVPMSEAARTLASANSFAKGTRGSVNRLARAAQSYGGKTIELNTADGVVKAKQIMRLS